MDFSGLRVAIDYVATGTEAVQHGENEGDDRWNADEITPSQIQLFEATEKFVNDKEHGQLDCTLSRYGFSPKSMLRVGWIGHVSKPAQIKSRYKHSSGDDAESLAHEAFKPYHKKHFTKQRRGADDLDAGEDDIYLDAEGHPGYESDNVGTVTCEGLALDVWEHELFFTGRDWSQNFLMQAGRVPSLSAERILRRLQELQTVGQDIGLNRPKDYEELLEFTGDFGMTYVDNSMKYQTSEQIRYLRMLLNRRDLFHDLTDNSSICTLVQSRDSQRLLIWNFLWQVILGHELSWRLLIAGWTSGITATSTFTPKLLATLIISQQWLTNVRVEKTSNAREQAKRLHREAAARRARFSSLAPDATAEECSASGTAALTAGDAVTAERCFSRALARRPRNATYRAGRAAAFVRLRSFINAEADARMAVEADPLCGEGWAALGSARLEPGKWEASVEAFEWAVDLLGEGGGGVPEAVREDLTKARRLLLEVGDLRFVGLSAEEQEKRLAEEEWKLEGCSLRFVSGVHQLQIDGLLFFAETLKWPYLDEVRVFTKDVYEKVVAGTLAIDADTWDWLYGLSLPGKYFALKICRALVGCTPSLLEMPLNGRFDAGLSLEQVSYWRVRSALGRVLGCLPGVRSVCGWVGPCPPVHGPRSQFIRLQTRRIAPLGEESADQSLFESDSPEEESIRLTKREPMEEWAKEIQDESLWVVPEAPEQDNSVWAIREIRLEEQPVENARSFIVGLTTPAAGEDPDIPYEAILDFEVNGSSVISFTLKTNPVFVTLPSCYNASNRVHSVHRRELRKYTRNIRTLQELRLAPDFPSGPGDVLVINTTGHGAETAARAWCAERGKSAAIRRSGGPCFVCAYNAVSSKGLSLQVLIWTSSADPEEVKGPCNVCKELCLEQTSSQKFRATLEDVERSADRGCSSCKLLQRGFAVADKTKPSAETSSLGQAWLSSHHYNQFAEYSFDGNWGRPDAEFRSSDRVINGAEAQGSGLCVTYAYRKYSSDRIDKAFEIDLFVDQETVRTCPWKSLPSARDISGDTGSKQSFDQAVSWIQDCEKNHKTCRPTGKSVLPDRVLDLSLGNNPSDNQSLTFLYETSREIPEEGQYVCLSHCWGIGKMPILTTSETIEAHKAGIPWSALPKTFQDAATFTRKLGIRYLWIDSLCIIQGDEDDLAKQLPQMPAIYENAYVTLAATFSGSSGGGCFSKAGPEFQAQCLDILDRSTGTAHRVSLRRHLPHWPTSGPGYSPSLESDSILLTRAWVLQERLLSARVLHFGRHELLWECRDSVTCECGFLAGLNTNSIDKIRHHRSLAAGAQSRRQHTTKWHDLVSAYSTLKLTQGADKLPALSGLASQLNRVVGDGYVAGLWRSSLIDDMLWETRVLDPLPRPKEWRAPSWSWASVDGTVTYTKMEAMMADQEAQPYVHITDIDIVPAKGDVTCMGHLTAASMKVEAEFCRAGIIIYARDAESLGATEPTLIAVGGRIFNDKLTENFDSPFLNMRSRVSVDIALPPTTSSVRFEDSMYGQELITREVLCMRFARIGDYEYIILLNCVDEPTQRYERIGIVAEKKPEDQVAGLLPWGNTSKCFHRTITLV